MEHRFFIYASYEKPIWDLPTHSPVLDKDACLLQHAYSIVTSVHWYVSDEVPVRAVYTSDAVAVGFVFKMNPGYKHLHILASLFEIPSLAGELSGVAVM